MMPVELPCEEAPAGTEFTLPGGPRVWIDDLLAGGAFILMASVLAPRAYRWARAQMDHSAHTFSVRH